MKVVLPFMLMLLVLGAAAGCTQDTTDSPAVNHETETNPPEIGSENKTEEQQSLPPEPVELTLYMEAPFPIQELITEKVHQKYPHFTVSTILRQEGQLPHELLAAGTFPDLVYAATPWYTDYLDLEILHDLNELVKKSDFDVGLLDPVAVDAIKMWGENGELYALPIYRNFAVMYYNKDLFDNFGVDYPVDGMTWDETIELAKMMTREVDSVEYKGLDASESYSAVSPLTVPFLTPEGKANLLDARFAAALNNLKEIYGIPGNRPGINMTEFYQGTVAMSVFWNVIETLEKLHKEGSGLNWDIVTTPTYDIAPGKSFQVDSHNLSISSVSENKEEAFQVITYMLSQEMQAELSKKGYLPSIVDSEPLQQVFGSELEVLEGKNIEAIFKQESAPLYRITRYDSIVMGELGMALSEVLDQQVDVNTALRAANERANQQIEQQRQSSE